MRTTHKSLIAAIAAACVLAACQTDPISGPSRIIGDPLLDMVFGPAGNAAFPVVSGQRITAAAARDTLEFAVNYLPPSSAGGTYQIVLVDTASGNMSSPTARIIRTMRSRRPVNRDSSVAIIKAEVTSLKTFCNAN